MSQQQYGSGRGMKILAGAGVVLAIGILGIVIWKHFGPAPSGKGVGQFTCESCSNRWSGDPAVAAKCPKCGAAGYICLWYMCPECRNVFQGMQTKRIDSMTSQARAPGAKEWGPMPGSLTCPGCSKPVADLLSAGVWSGYDAPPADQLPKTPRRMQ